jgi:oligo-1,6-glucosidase
MHREVLAGRHLITVGEMPGTTLAEARLFSDPSRGELDMVFTFEHMDLDVQPDGSKWELAQLALTRLKANLNAWQAGLGEVGWNSLYWNNHDQPRIVSRWGNDGEHRVASAKAFGTVLHLMRGTPYVYEGEELGMTNAGFTSLDQYRDLESLNWAAQARRKGRTEESILRALAVKSRDNARTPMQWDASPDGGFNSGPPWIQVHPNTAAINATAAVADPDSVFHHYRRLIEMRHTLPVIVHGTYRPLLEADEQVFAYLRSLGDTRLLVLANLSDRATTVPIDEALAPFAAECERIGSGITWHQDIVVLEPWASAAYCTMPCPGTSTT